MLNISSGFHKWDSIEFSFSGKGRCLFKTQVDFLFLIHGSSVFIAFALIVDRC